EQPAPERILPRLEYETEELPPVMVGEDFGSGTVPPRAGRRQERRRRRSAPGGGPGLKRADAVDPDGAGTLREGDSGPQVSELQQRLLRIPDVYAGGSTSGRYDGVLKDAVARFQLWYGIRGDETGVYGNDTRQDLESRTAL
ncbi:peptidoglycan-binding domain-containing protein, partial [Streptomyces scabiei]|uniref:peptidoglycan-binding domain-containing protein n=1 Tax=Streptomyces scabiei TaxID=1930 RepID=UPI0029BE0849